MQELNIDEGNVSGYYPEPALFLQGYETPIKSTIGTAVLYSDKGIQLSKIAQVKGAANPEPCNMESSSNPEISMFSNKQASLEGDAFAPLQIKGLKNHEAAGFWTNFQYKDTQDGEDRAIVGLHWVVNHWQAAMLNEVVKAIGLNQSIPKAALIEKMQDLEYLPSFKSQGLLDKLLKLFTEKFHMGTDEHPFKLQGFGGAEGGHRWTTDIEASAIIDSCPTPKLITFFTTTAYVTGAEQEVEVLLNGTHVSTYIYQPDQAQEIKVDIPPHLSKAKIAFKIPGAASPGGGDNRKLGLALRDVQFEY